MRVVVLYDGGATDWSAQDIRSVLEPVRTVSAVLTDAGHEVVRVAVQRDLSWLEAVRGCDLVFNLCEGIGGVSHLECQVAATLELAGVPMTGCSAWTITVCHRKPLLNALLQAARAPVPRCVVPEGATLVEDLPLPAIVKPAAEDASVGIDQGAVVTTREKLAYRVGRIQEEFGEALVQQYVEGREFNVGFVADHTLPLAEIDFRTMPEGAWPILSFDAKWSVGSAEDLGSRPVCPARVEPAVAERLLTTARAAWRAVRGRGYGRVDLRVDRAGRPWILEVNPNPDISTDAGLVRMAAATGWSYADLVLRIVDHALVPARPAGRRRAREQQLA